VAIISRPLGRTTNNVAEYTAVKLALERARELGAEEVELVLDSMLVVEQVAGRWRVRDPRLREIHSAIHVLLAGFRRWTVRHERRSENRAADALANLALDDPAAAAALESGVAALGSG
jgi:ribonuclease HI